MCTVGIGTYEDERLYLFLEGLAMRAELRCPSRE